MGNIEIFDRIAERYDTPERMEIARITVAAVKEYLSDTKGKTLIDYGCGTGLIGLALAKEFDKVLLADASPKMVEYVREKIEEGDADNAQVVCHDIENDSDRIIPADYVILVQALLHMQDTESVVVKLPLLIKENGHLIIVDFDKNDRVSSELIHNGFEQKALTELLKESGFGEVRSKTFYSGPEMLMNEEASLFVMDAVKS